MEDGTVRAKRLAHAIDEAIDHFASERQVDKVEAGKAIAKVMSVSARTVSRWMSGESVPDALELRPLADHLGVSPMLFVDPPEVPDYPLSEFLVREATAEGVSEGVRRAGRRQRRAAAGES